MRKESLGRILSLVNAAQKLNKLIEYSKQYKLLEPKYDEYYAHFERLKELRNRVHIYLCSKEEGVKLERDESKIYTEKELEKAKEVLEVFIKSWSVRHPREGKYSKQFVFPWDPKFNILKAHAT